MTAALLILSACLCLVVALVANAAHQQRLRILRLTAALRSAESRILRANHIHPHHN